MNRGQQMREMRRGSFHDKDITLTWRILARADHWNRPNALKILKKLLGTYLSQKVTQCPPNKGRASLGSQGVLVKGIIVSGPSGDCPASDLGSVAKQGTVDNRILAEGRLVDKIPRLLMGDRVRRDAEGGRNRKEAKKRKELHSGLLLVSSL
jgi:hypothetical protein